MAEEQAAITAARKEADHNPKPWKINDKWEYKILSFVVNGEAWDNRERMYSLLHHYHSSSVHTKSHMMGNSLADRILVDDRVTKKLAESTWTTTALHHGLQYGTQGPLSHPRWVKIFAHACCMHVARMHDVLHVLMHAPIRLFVFFIPCWRQKVCMSTTLAWKESHNSIYWKSQITIVPSPGTCWRTSIGAKQNARYCH